MSTIFTKELLQVEIPKIKDQFSWARNNMLKSEQGTTQHQRWYELMLHLGRQVVEMEEMAKNAPSEQLD